MKKELISIQDRIEEEHKQLYLRDNGICKIPTKQFLDGLFYELRREFNTTATDEEVYEVRTRMYFTNRRLNGKLYELRRDFDNVGNISVDSEDVFSICAMYMVNFWKEYEYIEIDYDNYTNNNDDISYMVFLMDKEVRRFLLDEVGAVRIEDCSYIKQQKKQDDEESRKYFQKFGNVLYLDSHINCEDGDVYISELISNEDVYGASEYYNPFQDLTSTLREEELESLNIMMDIAKLTKRQKDIVYVLLYCDFNQTVAAKELGITQQGISFQWQSIKRRFKKHFCLKKYYELKYENSLI